MRLAATPPLRSRLLPPAGMVLEATDLTAAILGESGIGNLLATVKLMLLPLEDPGRVHEVHILQQHEPDET